MNLSYCVAWLKLSHNCLPTDFPDFQLIERNPIRTAKDRIRHAICFEIIGLLLVTPLGSWAFGMPIVDIGVVAIVGVGIGMSWNYVFNLLFDHAMVKFVGDVRKSLTARVVHAVLFEIGFLIISVPFIAWYLGISILHALALDISFSVFFMCYAFVFNWAYDWIFPIPVTQGE